MTGAASDLGSRKATRPLEAADLDAFVATVWDHHRNNRRDLPWRRTHDPYEILVSEIMLQQTQVGRVLQRYPLFIAAFPTVHALADAEVESVLAAWLGLGYNRRALALHRAARAIVERHDGRVPDTQEDLCRLPGVGPATAAAVSAFAFGRGEAFIETNIRAAFIYHFFADEDEVPDTAILPLVAATIDVRDPREWFYALMDYGVWIKKTHGNPGRRSSHHAVQKPFSGSRRELRARIVRLLVETAPQPLDFEEILTKAASLGREAVELSSVLDDLAREGFVERDGAGYRIAGATDPDRKMD